MMELSILEARTRLDEAAAAAVAGERVVITRDGAPLVELVSAQPRRRPDWEAFLNFRREQGYGDGSAAWFDEVMSDPAFSRRILGLED
ncbi:hypothetical protein IP88_08580 [alpha proteobacterium AAP81b]|nr:hypothetical protein IP88_08580 [alpha proteobacterium AAP81b]